MHEQAERLLGQLSAILALILPDLQPAALDAVIQGNDDGGRHRAVFGKGAALIGRVKASATAVTGAPAGKPEATKAQGILAQLDDRPHLRAALEVWAETPRTWPRLYRILDEIEADLGQPVDKAGLCSRNARERFTHSAQHPAVAGVDARHSAKRRIQPQRPMSWEEAESFIHNLLYSCATRAGSASPPDGAGGGGIRLV